jgi:uncharacterized protein (TIGR02391 family)
MLHEVRADDSSKGPDAMNLETRLEPRLWEAVRESIEARRFSGAILDAIHFLSDTIRDRSGLESDGVQLVGAAFGGISPKLKVNRLQTDSEQNVQRGVESLLRGVYQAIRNPRSHGIYHDNEQDAVAIIAFLDYLLRIVDEARAPFSLPSLVARLFDPDFVPTERYARLLIAEIPENRRLAVCREVFAGRREPGKTKLRVFFKPLFEVMTSEDLDELHALISSELSQTDDDDTIRFVIAAYPADTWPKLSEIARLRIEHKLIRSVSEGKYVRGKKRCSSGSLGTWVPDIIYKFTLKDELWNAIFNKLNSTDATELDYALSYFMHHAPRFFDAPPARLIRAIEQGLESGNPRFREVVDGWQARNDGEMRPADDPWVKPFADALAKVESEALNSEGEFASPDDDEVPF